LAFAAAIIIMGAAITYEGHDTGLGNARVPQIVAR